MNISKEMQHQIAVDYSVCLYRGCALKCYQKVALIKKIETYEKLFCSSSLTSQ